MFAGSVGKTFAAATALRLVERGELSLDEGIAKYLGGRPWFSRLPNGAQITVRMLMNHSSGLMEHVGENRFNKSLIGQPDKIWKPDDLVAFVLDRRPLFEAGKGFSYADTNYILLGMVIEALGEKTLYQRVDEWFLSPLKLQHTSPAVGRELPGLIQGYTGPEPFAFPGEVVQNGQYVVNPQFEWTGGGFISTASDLALWGHHLYHGDLLNSASRAVMLQTIPMDDAHDSSVGYGLGVMVWQTVHGPAYGHGGIFPGYQTVVKHYLKYGITLAMQFNEDRTVNPEMKKAYDFPDLFVRGLVVE
jgi:D-alanyl-D-alanine carboxypeptidase